MKNILKYLQIKKQYINHFPTSLLRSESSHAWLPWVDESTSTEKKKQRKIVSSQWNGQPRNRHYQSYKWDGNIQGPRTILDFMSLSVLWLFLFKIIFNTNIKII